MKFKPENERLGVFPPALRVATNFAFTIVQIDKLTNDLASIHTRKQIDHCKKDPHPKTAGWMAGNQNSTLKHLLSTLATFTGRRKESEKEASQWRYAEEDRNLAYSLNGPFHRRSRDLGFFLSVFVSYLQHFYV